MTFIITVVLLLSWAFHELVEVRLSKKFSTLLFSLSDKMRNARRKPLPVVGSGGV